MKAGYQQELLQEQFRVKYRNVGRFADNIASGEGGNCVEDVVSNQLARLGLDDGGEDVVDHLRIHPA